MRHTYSVVLVHLCGHGTTILILRIHDPPDSKAGLSSTHLFSNQHDLSLSNLSMSPTRPIGSRTAMHSLWSHLVRLLSATSYTHRQQRWCPAVPKIPKQANQHLDISQFAQLLSPTRPIRYGDTQMPPASHRRSASDRRSGGQVTGFAWRSRDWRISGTCDRR